MTDNLSVTRRRAEAVKGFLVSEFQIDEKRLRVRPYGADNPVASNDSEDGRRLNNRIEFIRIR